ncbi:MAG: GNAT family N-acetyltransferase [Bacteroidales bacterium]
MKDAYRRLCETEATLPVFSRDWWLDAVCGEKKWNVLLIEEKGRVLAALPLYVPVRNLVSMPPYTQTMGPWFAACPADTKYTTALGRRQTFCKTFIGELRQYSSFLQNFNYKVTDWLPFYWEGYRQTTRYTYLLKGINRQDTLWENMSPNIRRNIKKARENIAVRCGIPADDFLRICRLTFARRQTRPAHLDVLKRLIAVCRERGQGDLWGGYDGNGRLHAAVFVVWQECSAYYLAGGSDPALRHSGAHSLVMWEAIQAVSAYTRLFDFEGSMIPGVERFFREFGAEQTPYFTISRGKTSLLDRALIKLSNYPLR